MQLYPIEIARIALERWQSCPDRIIDRMSYVEVSPAKEETIVGIMIDVGCKTPDFDKWLTNNQDILRAYGEAQSLLGVTA